MLPVNTSLVKNEDIPTSLPDLLNPKYRGNVAIANPLFGTTSFHFAALFEELGDDKAKQFLEGLKSNGLVIASSNGDVKKKVAAGEVAMGAGGEVVRKGRRYLNSNEELLCFPV